MHFSLTTILLALVIATGTECKSIGRRDAPYPPSGHSSYGVPEELKPISFVPEVKPALEILEISNELLPEKLPEIFTIPKVPEIKLEIPTIPAAEYGLPEINIPTKEYKVPEIEIPIIPSREYGLPEEIKVVTPEIPKVFVPEGLPELPPAPIIPVIKIEIPAKEYGVPAIPAREYGVPEEIKVITPEIPKVFVPEGLPELPPAPVIPEIKIEIPAKEYGVPEIGIPAIPAQEYGVPEEIKVITPEIPKVLVPEGLPELPPAPVIPEIKIEVPAKEYGVPEIEIPSIPAREYGVPEEIKVIVTESPKIPEIETETPEKKIEIPELVAPYPPESIVIKKPEVTLVHQESKPYIPKPVVVEKVIEKSFPYPAALPASTYGAPILRKTVRFL